MIYETFQSKRKVFGYPYTAIGKPTEVKPWYTPVEVAQATQRGLTPAEYVRRDMLVKQLALECPYNAGDTAYPSEKKEYEEYGAVFIVGIAQSYKDFEPDHKWPKNDNPMIVTFAPLKNRGTHIFCTTNFLQRTNTHLETC